MNKKVSILIPCYNATRYISETLQSCVAQDYPNIEIIVVDDGSTDNSVEVVKEWVSKYDNIHLYLQKNSGVCRARNLAFEKSTGDYILYLDADDLISHETVANQVELLKETENDVVATCAWGRFYESLDDFKLEQQPVYRDYETSIELIEDLLNDGMFGLTCYLTPRPIIEKAGLWDEQLTINTDGEFFIRVLANTAKIKYSRKGCLYYRSNNPNSISRRKPIQSKGLSLLHSYKLELNYLQTRSLLTQRVKLGLIRSFQSVAYQYVQFHDIVASAKACAESLGCSEGRVSHIGGFIFHLMCKCISFWNALTVKRLITSSR